MPSALDKFESAFNRLTVFFIGIVAISIALMAILLSANLIIIRLQLGSMGWLFEAIEYALYFGVFIGAPWVLQQGAHVRVDVILSALSKTAATRLDGFINIAGAAICLLLFFYGVRATLTEYVDGTLPDKDLRIANWIVLTAFSLSFLMLTLEFLLRLRKKRVLTLKSEAFSSDGAF